MIVCWINLYVANYIRALQTVFSFQVTCNSCFLLSVIATVTFKSHFEAGTFMVDYTTVYVIVTKKMISN